MNIPKLSFSFRLIIAYFLIIGALAWFVVNKALDTLDTSVRQSAEEVLVDSANLLAELIGQNLSNGQTDTSFLQNLIPAYLHRAVNARIYRVAKTRPDTQVYVTDASGKVLFDSTGKHLGEDFSQWRDVFLTLKGRYGARSSPANSDKPHERNKIMYVAAPVYHQGHIIGVVSVSKRMSKLDQFTLIATRQISTYAVAVLLASLLFGGLITWWLARSVRRLAAYADNVSAGKKAPPPTLGEKELNHLALAMDKMRRELDGKEYVENYIHPLAHELKSPLSGIRGAVELLEEHPPAEQRQRFLSHIEDSSRRMINLVERLLQLARVEKRQKPDTVQPFNLHDTVNTLFDQRREPADKKHITLTNELPTDFTVTGDPLLLEQAIANLLDNALDFTESGSITVTGGSNAGQYRITVSDTGAGIPANMLDKVFDRFVSLPRPDTRKRSTGLGLSFVREVMVLHDGKVALASREGKGTTVTMTWSTPKTTQR